MLEIAILVLSVLSLVGVKLGNILPISVIVFVTLHVISVIVEKYNEGR